jgi:toxin ParE1/3/4
MASSKAIRVELGAQQESLQRRLESGQYDDASAVMRAALRAPDREESTLDDVLREKVRASKADKWPSIAEQSSPHIAINYIRRIRESCLAPAHFPECGTRRDDLMPGLQTIGFGRRVTIAFRILKTRVEIVSIAYGGRDFESELRLRK